MALNCSNAPSDHQAVKTMPGIIHVKRNSPGMLWSQIYHRCRCARFPIIYSAFVTIVLISGPAPQIYYPFG
jgi:hypothetical protein